MTKKTTRIYNGVTYVQLCGFSNKYSASGAVTKLRKEGIPARLVEDKRNKYYWVYAKPFKKIKKGVKMDNKELNKQGNIYTLNRLLKEGKITQEQYDKRMDIIEQS